MTEITINGEVYRTGKMTAMEQFHVVRRLLPVVSALGSLTEGQGETGFLQSMAVAISKLSDEDCEFVIGHCLRVCQRQQGPAWTNVWNVAAKKPQFDDIDLAAMINLVTTTLSENLAGFFPALPSVSTHANSPPNAR